MQKGSWHRETDTSSLSCPFVTTQHNSLHTECVVFIAFTGTLASGCWPPCLKNEKCFIWIRLLQDVQSPLGVSAIWHVQYNPTLIFVIGDLKKINCTFKKRTCSQHVSRHPIHCFSLSSILAECKRWSDYFLSVCFLGLFFVGVFFAERKERLHHLH